MNPGQQGARRDDEKGIPPTILSPQPGDTVGDTVIVTGVSTCRPLILTWTSATGSMTVEVPVADPPDNTWTYTITGVSGDISIKVCCKRDPPPHEPCSEVTELHFSSSASASRPAGSSVR